ncbi:TIGR03915 family putative DNA repair protein [Pumilibacter muris]|uniref:TIGR03915 family putative DNA repair protein n=1 Tax=Pumilibacter muris TaxID=2941510 RepID=UPI00204057FE|nr:TIGR03915 family putative DNA repair protein [Pumilibacter muris]
MKYFNNKTAPIYVYDGSFDGLLCCLFSMFELKEMPSEVVKRYDGFLPCRNIESTDEKVARVKKGILRKMGREALKLGERAYLSELAKIERDVLEYFTLGFSVGEKLYRMLYENCVARVNGAAKYTMNERHRILQFLRFSDSDGLLTAVITSKANVLPLIAGHFEARFPQESFLIYDSSRYVALVCSGGKRAFVPLEEYYQPPPNAEELKYRELFKMFYDTIEIKERHNERCRMNHMPKRFWKNMTEFADANSASARTALEKLKNNSEK